VILVDVNILVYAHASSSRQHEQARDWLDRQINGSQKIGLPWASLLGFLRLITSPRIVMKPLPMASAWVFSFMRTTLTIDDDVAAMLKCLR
jgi:uncharacterized protein